SYDNTVVTSPGTPGSSPNTGSGGFSSGSSGSGYSSSSPDTYNPSASSNPPSLGGSTGSGGSTSPNFTTSPVRNPDGTGSITLSWTPGLLSTHTIIRRLGNTPPSTSAPQALSDGVQVYNERNDKDGKDPTDTHTYTDTGLGEDLIYCYSAWAYDERTNAYSNGFVLACGGIPPSDPSDQSLVATTSSFTLSFTKGSASNTVIRRAIDTPPSSQEEGTLVYNGTASSFTDSDPGLTKNTAYCYSIWSYNPSTAALSTSHVSACGTLSNMSSPTDLTFPTIAYNSIILNWNRGTGSTRTYIVRKQGSIPTSRTDGTNIYDDTGNAFIDTGLTDNTEYCYALYGTDGTEYTEPLTGCQTTQVVNGTCGSSNDTNPMSVPTTDLCEIGTASSVSGVGPWTWTCAGGNGGTTANCSAAMAKYKVISFSTPGIFTWTVPEKVDSIILKLWGGGGGGGYSGSGLGGGGGSASGMMEVVSGSSYSIVVGGGGKSMAPEAGPGSEVIGGGGLVGNVGYGGQGGGYSGLFAVSISQSNAYLIAAGGGGGSYEDRHGGAGGGSVGMSGSSGASVGGGGGTQIAGGTSDAQAGSALKGGNCGSSGNGGGGGAGGGGYYGGGAGTGFDPGSGGGGGSSYYNPTYITSAALTAGSGRTPGNSSDADRGNAGLGGSGTGAGNSGIVVIKYINNDGICGTATSSYYAAPPTANLCENGIPSVVSGSGPYTWICKAYKDGISANCSTSYTPCISGNGLTCTETFDGNYIINKYVLSGSTGSTIWVGPKDIASVEVYAWGGGGAGGYAASGTGGGGGAANGTVIINQGTPYMIVVGGGGASMGPEAGTGPAVNGGGGLAGLKGYGGQGGGYSGLFAGSISQSNAYLIAGGGGGGSYEDRHGGAGGGSVGVAGGAAASIGGGGGTQVGGGTSAAQAGSALKGGDCGSSGDSGGGGAGGGGYYGGGAGAGTNPGSSGGGGSSYFDPVHVTSAVLTAGSGITPGDSSNSFRGVAGNGGAAGANAGKPGVLIIKYLNNR
ncbi:MAG: glycine-rich protein, partial [Candidatus Pacebacteria bacterium]|nr:glycine-rich protein [Candidatus Paceibacterota bacterium]